ncbi:DUF4440 domain-containing protein [Roseobacter sp. HKCCD9010]|uniref:YybH family protein n=1 Tax=unclassified Roseobacter TaxID=196798 RepID=UPI001492174E|nr:MULTISPECIES: nuclear transport factor 2 family protein [unclassified Roseobacter]MBF9050238.1 DUF4440 domain-containing protein [Rhodobacterales bacterium HKCCD4356]NNV12481.1 DUF4440 domain-containing protein [Roseobacter sp. HKCCD7357]NNV16054.1 DUF4440 domain-containing protein [Roseobacter sp. HKCCD8768]NNV25514.1 DUF4440 domain-containing protein [Roseobacter sp. HKCCD8192]NNV29771.1 DUF4440 domain-containing protein [Roseobacter sp. HKCCD9061]
MTSVQTPEDMSPALAAAFNARDLDAMAALYEDEAVLIDEAGAKHQGIAAIKSALKDMLESGGVMTSSARLAVIVGDIALSGADWWLDPGDGGETLEGRSLEVLRRQSDGSWRYLIDCPSGFDKG